MSFLKRAAAGLALLIVLCIPVSAAQTGSIEVALPGGSLTLYRVDDTFPDCSGSNAADAARKWADYAKTNALPGETRTVGETGTVHFEGLEDGLYLLAQWKPAAGYLAVRPFLVSLGESCREVYAKPKLEKEPQPGDGEIPETGEAYWPLPVYTAGGSLLLLAVWVTCFGHWRQDGRKSRK